MASLFNIVRALDGNMTVGRLFVDGDLTTLQTVKLVDRHTPDRRLVVDGFRRLDSRADVALHLFEQPQEWKLVDSHEGEITLREMS